MKFEFLVSMFLSLMILCTLGGNMVYTRKERKELEEYKLSLAIDLCSDAAVEEMLNTSDLGMDYTKYADVKVDPQIALDTFVTAFCYNYGIANTDVNRQHIMLSFIPAFTVAGNDGYYIATPTATSDEQFGLVFNPKMPYPYRQGDDLYALNIMSDECLKLNSASMDLVRTKNLPEAINTHNKRSKIINDTLTSNIGYELDKLCQKEPFWKNTFFLPGNLTSYTGVNPVEGPSVLALVQNVDLQYNYPVSAFSIAGSKLKANRQVMGYERDGKQYYCYIDEMPVGNDNKPVYPAKQVFRTPEAAAKQGYQCDIKYFGGGVE